MKRLLCFCLSLLLLLPLAACSKDKKKEETPRLTLYKVSGRFTDEAQSITVNEQDVRIIPYTQELAYVREGAVESLDDLFEYTLNGSAMYFSKATKYYYEYSADIPESIKYTDGTIRYTAGNDSLELNNKNELVYLSRSSNLPVEFTPLSSEEMLNTAKQTFTSITGVDSIKGFEITSSSYTEHKHGQDYPIGYYQFMGKICDVSMLVATIKVNSAGNVISIVNNYSKYKVYKDVITSADLTTARNVLDDCIRQASAYNKDPAVYTPYIWEGSLGLPILVYNAKGNDHHIINVIPTKLEYPF